MKNDIFSFQFGIRVVELENFITTEIQKIKAKAHQDIDISRHLVNKSTASRNQCLL